MSEPITPPQHPQPVQVKSTITLQPPSQAKTSGIKNLSKKIFGYKFTPIILVGALVVSVAMITYILVAPARDSSNRQFAYTTNNIPQLLINPPTQTPTPAPTNIPTATPTITPTPSPTPAIETWKTYTNSQYGYSIKYPPDWTYQDLGALEPKVPSYVVFNTNTASSGARSISVAIGTRTYTDQLAIEGPNGTAVTLSGITGSKQNFKDSNGSQSTSIILPRTNDLLMLRSKSAFLTIFNFMISTLTTTK